MLICSILSSVLVLITKVFVTLNPTSFRVQAIPNPVFAVRRQLQNPGPYIHLLALLGLQRQSLFDSPGAVCVLLSRSRLQKKVCLKKLWSFDDERENRYWNGRKSAKTDEQCERLVSNSSSRNASLLASLWPVPSSIAGQLSTCPHACSGAQKSYTETLWQALLLQPYILNVHVKEDKSQFISNITSLSATNVSASESKGGIL